MHTKGACVTSVYLLGFCSFNDISLVWGVGNTSFPPPFVWNPVSGGGQSYSDLARLCSVHVTYWYVGSLRGWKSAWCKMYIQTCGTPSLTALSNNTATRWLLSSPWHPNVRLIMWLVCLVNHWTIREIYLLFLHFLVWGMLELTTSLGNHIHTFSVYGAHTDRLGDFIYTHRSLE